uniref:Uncharacterized protein n=1 Tax=Vitis vinifera TaxID=29760 RepID=A5AGY9_VITVI|nr:hypothetical protein VITISV_007001 [Vitis vinifera]
MAMASQRRRPFQRPPLSIRPPLSASENLPISDTRVPIDEVRSSNQVPMDDGSMSSSQKLLDLDYTLPLAHEVVRE